MSESESILETIFIDRLKKLGYKLADIHDESQFLRNLKEQLEDFNETVFTDNEFKRILNHLNSGSRYKKASNLRDRFLLKRDDASNGFKNPSETYIRFLNTDKWCQNNYQVTRQMRVKGTFGNRYDVTLLVNGLPLVQIELKKRGVELKEAFNQIKRYRDHSYMGTLFEHIQIFIISNGVNTKYFANNQHQGFEKTFYWTNEHNNKITNIEEFTDIFLEPCHISKMIAKYIVLGEDKNMPMILRPYQYYAVEKIIEKVENSVNNGYIWHTTGSGKTLTSFKASQVIKDLPDVAKVLFVVDRKDLDTQTVKKFNEYCEGSVDGTENTKELVKQLKDDHRKLIVTTIQKLDIAINKEHYNKQFEFLKDKKIVIIFDECHRSQFGKTHANIKRFFNNTQLFGFTGTPIFKQNCIGGVTTADVFGKCLHKYVITDAISDNNVLGFSVEYIGKYITKDENSLFNEDIEVDINNKKLLENDKRIETIVDYILSAHKKKTKNIFNAILATDSIEILKKYYKLFKAKQHDFKIAAIFSYQVNEERSDFLDVDAFASGKEDKNSRDFLEDCIKDYNNMFHTNFSTELFYNYFKDVQNRLRGKEIDILIVVNMFLTGFDSPTLNTLYIDKNLRYHGLIQAYSRTNRLYNPDEKKPHGNIVCFRDLKANTDDALALFGNENAKDIVFKEPYEKQKEKFINKVAELKNFVPTYNDVNNLKSESDKIKFVKCFRDIMKLKSSLETYMEFSFDDVNMDEDEYANFQSKYLDIYKKRCDSGEDKDIDNIDFLIELIREDIINYDYIINLLTNLKSKENMPEYNDEKEKFLSKINRDITSKDKEPYIRKFIENYMPHIKSKDIEKEYNIFMDIEKKAYINKVAEEENLDEKKFAQLIENYNFSGKLPLSDEIVSALKIEPKLKERFVIINKIKEKMKKI
ncbi:MAG: type I restriction endonuclease subunit R, partial [Candidatus Acidulodesulfobacterium sp.]